MLLTLGVIVIIDALLSFGLLAVVICAPPVSFMT